MDSTPPAIPISYIPDRMAAATLAMACNPELHCLLTVVHGTDSGIPAKRDAILTSFAP